MLYLLCNKSWNTNSWKCLDKSRKGWVKFPWKGDSALYGACWNFIPELNIPNFSSSNILLSFPIKKLNSGCSPFHWFPFPLDSLSPYATMKFTGTDTLSKIARQKKKREKKSSYQNVTSKIVFDCVTHAAFHPLGSESTKRGCGWGGYILNKLGGFLS